MSTQDDVREFHEKFRLPVRSLVTNGELTKDEADLRMSLLDEEVDELRDGVDEKNIIDIADGLADVVYIAYGTALSYGIDLDTVLAEVHRSNMSKLGKDGHPIYREDGKVLKGPNYSRPDILSALIEGKVEPVVEPREIKVGDLVQISEDPSFPGWEGRIKKHADVGGCNDAGEVRQVDRIFQRGGATVYAAGSYLYDVDSLELIP